MSKRYIHIQWEIEDSGGKTLPVITPPPPLPHNNHCSTCKYQTNNNTIQCQHQPSFVHRIILLNTAMHGLNFSAIFFGLGAMYCSAQEQGGWEGEATTNCNDPFARSTQLAACARINIAKTHQQYHHHCHHCHHLVFQIWMYELFC